MPRTGRLACPAGNLNGDPAVLIRLPSAPERTRSGASKKSHTHDTSKNFDLLPYVAFRNDFSMRSHTSCLYGIKIKLMSKGALRYTGYRYLYRYPCSVAVYRNL